jgi:hypothetical protein
VELRPKNTGDDPGDEEKPAASGWPVNKEGGEGRERRLQEAWKHNRLPQLTACPAAAGKFILTQFAYCTSARGALCGVERRGYLATDDHLGAVMVVEERLLQHSVRLFVTTDPSQTGDRRLRAWVGSGPGNRNAGEDCQQQQERDNSGVQSAARIQTGVKGGTDPLVGTADRQYGNYLQPTTDRSRGYTAARTQTDRLPTDTGEHSSDGSSCTRV